MVVKRAALVLSFWFVGITARGACFQSTVQPIDPPYIPPGTTHQAYALADPIGQQTAYFDLAWGGTLASLKYGGTEMIWGGDPGAMVQPAWFYYPSPTGYPYNPEQAGGNPLFGTPTLGAGCIDSNTLLILSGSTDYFFDLSGYAVANPVVGGSIEHRQFTTPYTITTTARFVPNPGGTPAYYLKVTQTVMNNHPTELFAVSFGIAMYVPFDFQCFISDPPQCSLSSMCAITTPGGGIATPRMLEGMYSDAAHTFGSALLIKPSQFALFGSTEVWAGYAVNSSDPRGNASGANTIYLAIAPRAALTYDFYVLVGTWASALSFSNTQ
jgi:hypothetical protein